MLEFCLAMHGESVVAGCVPVCFVQDYQLVSPQRQRHLLLSKALDSVSNNVDSSLIAGIQFEHGFLVCVAEQRTRKTEDGCGLADSRHSRNDDMGHISIFCNDFQSFNGLGVAYDIVKIDRSVFLNPVRASVIWTGECEG